MGGDCLRPAMERALAVLREGIGGNVSGFRFIRRLPHAVSALLMCGDHSESGNPK